VKIASYVEFGVSSLIVKIASYVEFGVSPLIVKIASYVEFGVSSLIVKIASYVEFDVSSLIVKIASYVEFGVSSLIIYSEDRQLKLDFSYIFWQAVVRSNVNVQTRNCFCQQQLVCTYTSNWQHILHFPHEFTKQPTIVFLTKTFNLLFKHILNTMANQI